MLGKPLNLCAVVRCLLRDGCAKEHGLHCKFSQLSNVQPAQQPGYSKWPVQPIHTFSLDLNRALIATAADAQHIAIILITMDSRSRWTACVLSKTRAAVPRKPMGARAEQTAKVCKRPWQRVCAAAAEDALFHSFAGLHQSGGATGYCTAPFKPLWKPVVTQLASGDARYASVSAPVLPAAGCGRGSPVC